MIFRFRQIVPDKISDKFTEGMFCIRSSIRVELKGNPLGAKKTPLGRMKVKVAKIMPLLKKPNIFKVDNFRPISLLPCISKILEKCVFKQLNEYFEKHKLLYNSQYGYRQGHSTESACMELIDKLHQQLDNSKRPLCIFIDLSKAFDTLNHVILLSKLKYYGLDENAISWFKSYLSDRKQYVEIENVKSSIKDIQTGVPQGSTLGPLLFIIYMNDISLSSNLLKSTLGQ